MSAGRGRVVVADPLDLCELQPLTEAGFQVDDASGLDRAGLLRGLPGAVGLLVRSRTQVDEELIAAATELRVVGRAGTGVDNIDLDAATHAGILVMNVPGGNSNAAAEHTIALMLALARQVAPAAWSLREGNWDRKRFVGVEVAGRTLGVIGLGRIGREVVRKARGLGMKVLGHDPVVPAGVVEAAGAEPASIDDVARRSDFVTVHVPLVERTRHMIGRRFLELARPELRILNVARGGIVDEAALLEALEEERVAGAALDVFEQEPPRNRALIEHPRVLATPHLGASTVEAQAGVARLVSGQVVRFLRDDVVENAVNAVALSPEVARELAPWFPLARRLGRLAAGLAGGGFRRVEVTLMGRIAVHPTEPLTAEVLRGVLASFSEERLTPVNAPILAGERGLAVSELRREKHPSFQSVLRVAVRDEEGEGAALDGTLFGLRQQRIVRAFGFNIDAIPEGHMVFCRHADCPGIIGHLGTTLAAAGINIANMSVGRDPEQHAALAVLNLDETPTADTLAEMARLPDIRWIRHVDLETS